MTIAVPAIRLVKNSRSSAPGGFTGTNVINAIISHIFQGFLFFEISKKTEIYLKKKLHSTYPKKMC